mmetsp:Transcript_3116/g.9680  ORF Transcript_3116/g.9680 Transcript_3116/m.9680 type:complete len:330 (+) Transcript_3116:558-1547(+)
MHALYTATDPDGRSARTRVRTSSGVVALIAITSESHPSASHCAVSAGDKRRKDLPAERTSVAAAATAGAPSAVAAAPAGAAATESNARGALTCAPLAAMSSSAVRTSSSGAAEMAAQPSGGVLSMCTPSSGTCGRAWATSSEPRPAMRCASAPVTRPIPVSTTSTRAPARTFERARRSASESARSSRILSSLPSCAYVSHSSTGVGLRTCTTGVYLRAFFFKYLCCENVDLPSNVAECCAISRTRSSPCMPCARSVAISAAESDCAVPSSKSALLVRCISLLASAARAHSANVPVTSSASRSSIARFPPADVTIAPNGTPTRPSAGRRA